MDELKDYLPSFVAIVAIIVSPIVSLKVANSHIAASEKINRRQIIAPMRQAWLNDLRIKISELLHLLDRLYVFLHGNKELHNIYNKLKWEFVPSDADRRIELLNYEIYLLLYSDGGDHNNITELINKCKNSLYDKDLTQDGFYKTHSEILHLCAFILKSEWERWERVDKDE